MFACPDCRSLKPAAGPGPCSAQVSPCRHPPSFSPGLWTGRFVPKEHRRLWYRVRPLGPAAERVRNPPPVVLPSAGMTFAVRRVCRHSLPYSRIPFESRSEPTAIGKVPRQRGERLMAYRIVNANHPDPMLKRKPRRARIIWHSARQRRAARSLAAIATPPNATLLQNFSIYLPGLALPFALFPPLPPFVPFPPLPPFALFPPLPPFPTFEPPPDAAMAAEVRLVESNMVTAGGVIAAKRPQAFETSRLSSSAGEFTFRCSSNAHPPVGCASSTEISNDLGYNSIYGSDR